MHTGSHHSHFFLDVIRQKEFASEFLQLTLPEDLQKLLDLSQPTIEDSHYIDEELQHFQSDVLFSLPRQNAPPWKLYLLFEHKSHPDKNILFQLLKYLRLIHIDQPMLSPVIALVFHHGRETWNLPRSFLEAFSLSPEEKEAAQEYVLNFRYILVDVKEMNLQELRTSLALRAFLVVLRDIWKFSSEERLQEFFREYRQLFFEDSQLKFLEKLLVYIYRVKEIRPKKMYQLLENDLRERAEMAWTHMGRLELEAREEGLQEGRQEGRREAARQMLTKGYREEDIIEITGLSPEELQKLR